MLDVLLCLACLAALCLFFASLRGVSSASAPLLALSCAILWFAAFGMLGLLRLGGGLFYGLGLGLGGLALFKGRTKLVKNLFSPGLLLFFAGAVVLAVWLGLLQPQFTGWDEYSSWGIAAKITKVAGQLYPVADSGFRWTMTEYPALVVLSCFAQFFGAFAPWKVYWAYGLLYLACVAAMLAPFGKRQWRLAVPLAVCGLALPFFFSARYETVELATAWLSAYADLPGGMLFGGVLCLYFGVRQSKYSATLWQVLLPLAVLGIVKENIMPVALVAAGVFACDTLFFGGAEGPARGRALAKRLAWCVSYFAVVLIPFLAWKAYAQWANTLNPIMNGAQTNDVSATDALAMALREVFGPAPLNETARQVLRVLADSFLGRVALGDGTYAYGTLRASMAGTGLVTLLFIVAVFAVAVLLAKTARRRGRIALAGGLLLGGFFAFHFMLFVTYAYISHQQDVFDYHRYIATYTTGWLMLGLLCSCGWNPPEGGYPHPHPATSAQRAERSRRCGLGLGRGLISRTLILALACFMFWRCAVYLRPGYSVLDAPKTTWDAQRARQAAAQPYADAMGPQGRAFFVCQGGLGNEFMEWHYDLYPTIVMDSINGGRTLEPPPADAPPLNDYAGLERVREYLAMHRCDYILIDAIDEGFVENYGVLFADLDPAAAPALYRLGPDGLYARVEV